MKACCTNKFSDEALSVMFKYLNEGIEEDWAIDTVTIREKEWCELYKEEFLENYTQRFPPQQFEELGFNYPIKRRILMTNLLRDKFERHEIIGFTKTTIIYSDY